MKKFFFIGLAAMLFAGCIFLFSCGKEEEIQKFTITVNVGPNGTVSPSGTVSVEKGQNQAFEFIPNPGFLPFLKVDDVVVFEVSLIKVNSYALLSYELPSVFSNKNLDVTSLVLRYKSNKFN